MLAPYGDAFLCKTNLSYFSSCRVSLIYVTIDDVSNMPSDLPMYCVPCIDAHSLSTAMTTHASNASLPNAADKVRRRGVGV